MTDLIQPLTRFGNGQFEMLGGNLLASAGISGIEPTVMMHFLPDWPATAARSRVVSVDHRLPASAAGIIGDQNGLSRLVMLGLHSRSAAIHAGSLSASAITRFRGPAMESIPTAP